MAGLSIKKARDHLQYLVKAHPFRVDSYRYFVLAASCPLLNNFIMGDSSSTRVAFHMDWNRQGDLR